MSDDAGTEQKAHRGERLAQAIYWVRHGVATGLADCRLLVSEIDRLVAENIRLRSHDCEQWLTDARCCRRCSAEFSRILEQRERELPKKEPEWLRYENKRLNRELDMARAARNVALDKLIQIARIVSPNDFECEDVPRDPVARAVWMRAQADALLAHMDPAVWPEEADA